MTDTRQAVIEAAACMNPDSDGVEFVSADFLMALDAHTAAVRAEALEEAAKVCDGQPEERMSGSGAWGCNSRTCANAIRALKGPHD